MSIAALAERTAMPCPLSASSTARICATGIPVFRSSLKRISRGHLPNRSIVGALHLDPAKTDLAKKFGLPDHAAYSRLIPGISLGTTNLTNPLTFLDLFPDYTTNAIKRRIARGGRVSDAQRAQFLTRSLQQNTKSGGLPIGEELFERLLGVETQPRIIPHGLGSGR